MKTLNTIYLWLMLAACVLALAGCVEEKVSGTGEGGNISVKMNVNARGGSDIQAEMENAVKSLRVYAFIGQKQIGYYRGTTGLNPDAGGKISFGWIWNYRLILHLYRMYGSTWWRMRMQC